jgi:hypothetical protein
MAKHSKSDKEINLKAIVAKKNGATPKEIATILRSSSRENQRAFINRVRRATGG